jgi:hypothetical protein
MSATIAARISKLEKELESLKVELNKENKDQKDQKNKGIKKPKKIDDCESIEQVKKFTTIELKEWLNKNKINVKKVTEKHKDDFVKIVWENISSEYESEYSDEDESDGDEDESDEWEYYYA